MITEFMEQEQVEALAINHNISYEPEIYANSKALIEKSSDIDALIVRNKTNVDRKLLDSIDHLKVIGRLGVGLDNIDTKYCKDENIVPLKFI